MTPQEFVDAVVNAERQAGGDNEGFHIDTDTLMEQILTDLGYGEGVKRIQKSHLGRWYA